MTSKAQFISVSKHRTISFTENAKGLLLKSEKNGKLLERRQIVLLSQKPTSELEEIGTARGEDMFHCIYLASRYGKNFVEKVVAYFVDNRPKDEKFKMEVVFYKRKKGE